MSIEAPKISIALPSRSVSAPRALDRCASCTESIPGKGMAEMTTQHSTGESAQDRERRTTKLSGKDALAGVPCRDNDIEPTQGLHSVAILFRIMAATLILLMILQVMSGVTSTIEISYGVLVAEAVRLVIFAGLLWGAGDL